MRINNERGTWGAVIGGVVSIGAGAASKAIAGNPQGSGGGYDTFNPAPKPDKWSQQALSMHSNNMNRMNEGKLPVAYEGMRNQQNQAFEQGLNNTFFGSEGNRGNSMMGQIDQMAALGGIGNPRAMLAQKKKALIDMQAQRWGQQQQSAGQDMNAFMGMQQLGTNTLMGARNPQQQAIQFAGSPNPSAGWQNALGQLDFSKMGGGISSGIHGMLNNRNVTALGLGGLANGVGNLAQAPSSFVTNNGMGFPQGNAGSAAQYAKMMGGR